MVCLAGWGMEYVIELFYVNYIIIIIIHFDDFLILIINFGCILWPRMLVCVRAKVRSRMCVR